MGLNGIKSAYLTGKGRIIMRAPHGDRAHERHAQPHRGHGDPYQVNKARLVEKIAELVHDKRVDGISDLRDESDRQGMRIVIELKKDVNPQVVLNTLLSTRRCRRPSASTCWRWWAACPRCSTCSR